MVRDTCHRGDYLLLANFPFLTVANLVLEVGEETLFSGLSLSRFAATLSFGD